jgi:hypothetical protein
VHETEIERCLPRSGGAGAARAGVRGERTPGRRTAEASEGGEGEAEEGFGVGVLGGGGAGSRKENASSSSSRGEEKRGGGGGGSAVVGGVCDCGLAWGGLAKIDSCIALHEPCLSLCNLLCRKYFFLLYFFFCLPGPGNFLFGKYWDLSVFWLW